MATHRAVVFAQSFENHPIPFHNTIDDHPYAHFIYTPSQIFPSSSQSQRQSWGSLGFSISASRLGVEPVSLVDELGHNVFGCDCDRCDDEDPEGCPCFSEMEELDMGNKYGPSCGCGLECENRLTQQGVSVGVGLRWRSVLGWCFSGVDRR
ncbi:histone-lysine n-methyltransferase suvr3 [Quercus suber]|uniref:Histone-lysine n-methyltransferase suvr3 n=1 Tax=Quercus suber TaxID=58331 RepID=A0AAW0L924_QUESU